jgi:hypothetical protein
VIGVINCGFSALAFAVHEYGAHPGCAVMFAICKADIISWLVSKGRYRIAANEIPLRSSGSRQTQFNYLMTTIGGVCE